MLINGDVIRFQPIKFSDFIQRAQHSTFLNDTEESSINCHVIDLLEWGKSHFKIKFYRYHLLVR